VRGIGAVACFAAIAIVFASSTSRAQDPGAKSPIVQEVVGLEFAPASLNWGQQEGSPAPNRAQVGIGGSMRIGKHRWPTVYWVPVLVGVFAGGSGFSETISAHIQTEGGFILRSKLGVLELGLAAGAGLLGIEYVPTGCDGSCRVGGTGLHLSPVARYLFRETLPTSLGVSVRAQIPFGNSFPERCISWCTSDAVLFLAAFELGFGWR
jgi:hypothetical protein